MGMALGWHELLLWRRNEGWWIVCSKEKVQHYYENIYQSIWDESEFRMSEKKKVRGACGTSVLNAEETIEIIRCRIVHQVVGNRNYFVLNTLFNRKPVK